MIIKLKNGDKLQHTSISHIRKMQTAAGGPLFPWLLNTEYVDNWKFRMTPASRSRVLSGKGVETDKQYTERRKKETTKRTWRSNAADIAHGIGEGVLALHPYTAIPYFGAKVGLDFLNGTYGWHTALNASVPLFHLAPAPASVGTVVDNALEDAANAGSKTARNWRVAREVKRQVSNNNLNLLNNLFPVIRTKVGDVEINNPGMNYRVGTKEIVEDFQKTGKVRAGETNAQKSSGKAGRFLLKKETFTNPMFKKGSLWYLPSEEMNGLLTTSEPLITATKSSAPVSNNGVFTILGKTFVNDFGGRRIPAEGLILDKSNTTSYIWKPGYGYKKVVQEPSTSLKFFERKPSRLTEAEKAGIPKGERFVPRWHVANYPGYLLKGLIKGSLLERQLSKQGTININLLNAYFNKASQIEKEIANKVLTEKFAGLKTIDYNLFKKAVLDELVGSYNRVPSRLYEDYGINGLGYKPVEIEKYSEGFKNHAANRANKLIRYANEHYLETDPVKYRRLGSIVDSYMDMAYGRHFLQTKDGGINYGVNLNTFTFESPKILQGSDKHYSYGTLGHSRTYTTPEEPKVLHIMESLSDWAQEGIAKTNEAYRQKLINNPEFYNKRTNSLLKMNEELKDWENMVRTGINHAGIKLQPYETQQIQQEFIPNLQKNILNLKSKLEGNPQALHLSNNYLLRQLQENLRYAAENGLTKMRYPTSETAAKIEGYLKKVITNPEVLDELRALDLEKMQLYNKQSNLGIFDLKRDAINKRLAEIELREQELGNMVDYSPEHQTILKKYADFPKLFLKLFKDQKVRTITDTKENTWYEVDVPKGYLNREWQFRQGGKMKLLFLKNGSGIHIKKKNKGKFTSYCGGKVTGACIAKAKASGNPTLVKRATFAANARKWKHLEGGKLCLIPRN